MKILKKVFIILIMVMMICILTACEDKKSNNKDDETINYIATRNSKKKENNIISEKKESDKGNNMKKYIDNFINDIKNVNSEQALQSAENQMAIPNEGDQIAIFHIKGYGDVKVKFFNNIAPEAVENFITHAKDGYYNGVIFHRIIEEFMIQGGDPEGTGYGGESIWGKGFEEELSVDALPYRGALCMASSGTGTSSLGSQFFIVQANYRSEMESYLETYGLGNFKEAYKKYGGDLVDLVGYGQYTTFGQVIEGMDIVDNIAKVEKDNNDKPLEDVIIESIEITTY